MSTSIEWTQRPGTKGETWNPVVGCTKVSAGCKHCYAKTIHDNRHKAFKEGKLQNVKQYAVPFEQVQLMPERLTMPLKWKSPRTIFVNSVSDLFHADVPFSFIDQVFAVMALTPQHTYQILTKRPERMAEYLTQTHPPLLGQTGRTLKALVDITRVANVMVDAGYRVREPIYLPTDFDMWPLPNVWLGTSVENQAAADERIPHLLRCPAAVRFLSCEPLLGKVDLPIGKIMLSFPRHITADGRAVGASLALHWVIAGGESGSKARPMHPDWARGLRDQCAAAGVPFFFKQWGEYMPTASTPNGIPRMANGTFWWIAPDGTLSQEREDPFNDGSCIIRPGKKYTGRWLDGVEHSAWPTPQWQPKSTSFEKQPVRLVLDKENEQP